MHRLGGSAGREGPVVQIGASVGSTLTQIFRVTRKHGELLVACGAAGGIAAVFSAPIAGAFFAAEIITGRFEMRDLSLLFTASAMGAVVSRALLHSQVTFAVPSYELISVLGLGFHAILGILCAMLGHLFIRLLHQSEAFFSGLKLPLIAKPALGGLLVGVIGLWIPQVFGTGGELLGQIFAHPVAPGLLLIWMMGKLVATPLTLGSGGSGGDLMPVLFLGGTLGGAFGHGIHSWFPTLTMGAGAYALVGATSLFAGVAHAPMTAIILGFEMGQDYGVVLPLMISCSVSALVAKRLRTGSLYTMRLIEKGVDVEHLRGTHNDPFDLIRVSEVMNKTPTLVSPDMSVEELSRQFIATGRHGFLVIEQGKLVGIVTLADVQKTMKSGAISRTVREILTGSPIVCYPEDTLNRALARLGHLEVGRMPVVSRSDPSKALGVLSRSDVLRGYGIGASRQR